MRATVAHLSLALLLLFLPSSLHAWGREGHEIIAIVAEQRLQPVVREKVLALLDGTSFTEAATWADKVRNQQTAPWEVMGEVTLRNGQFSVLWLNRDSPLSDLNGTWRGPLRPFGSSPSSV
jgi:S1/P1 Nuclease